MPTHDKLGREYARLDTLKAGDLLESDGGFGCLDSSTLHVVKRRGDGHLYIDCEEGAHFLEGQVDDDAGDHCVGLYLPRTLSFTEAQLTLVRTAVEIAYVDDDAPVYDDDSGYAAVGALAAALGMPHPRDT